MRPTFDEYVAALGQGALGPVLLPADADTVSLSPLTRQPVSRTILVHGPVESGARDRSAD